MYNKADVDTRNYIESNKENEGFPGFLDVVKGFIRSLVNPLIDNLIKKVVTP